MTAKSLSSDTSEGKGSIRRQALMRSETDALLQRTKKGAFFGTALGVIVGVLAGAVLGVMVMRQRQHAREVVTSINGVVIDQQNFYHNLEKTAGTQVIRRLVGEELELQYARKLGVSPSEQEVETQLTQAISKPGFNKETLKNAEAMQDLRRSIRVNIARSNVLTRGVTISEAEVAAYYKANIDPKNLGALFYTPEHINLQVIVNADEAKIRIAEKDLANGVPFATVAKNYSTNESRTNGGQLASIRRSQVSTGPQAEAENAFFSMKIGAQLGPRKFKKDWWIVRCLDRQLAQIQPLANVKDQCRKAALLSKGIQLNGKKVEEEFNAYQQTANVQAFWSRYSAATNLK